MEHIESDRPFANTAMRDEFIKVFTEHKYKLYDSVDFKVVDPPTDQEVDLYGGEIHYTETDLLAISKNFAELNKKFDLHITYCLFPSSKFPNGIVINVRGPNAPFALVT